MILLREIIKCTELTDGAWMSRISTFLSRSNIIQLSMDTDNIMGAAELGVDPVVDLFGNGISK